MANFGKDVGFAELIPELKEWNSGKGIDIRDWIGCEGDHKHLVGYARILWPDFAEHDGCVFLAESFDKGVYKDWLAQTKGDKKRVEAVMNHQHIADLFSPSHRERPTREVIVYIGRLMKDILQTKLRHDFPNRKIAVSFDEDGVEDLIDYQITFFQEQ
jgi:hypothetical protein